MSGAEVFEGVAGVLELHQPGEDGLCMECGHAYPCATTCRLGVTQ